MMGMELMGVRVKGSESTFRFRRVKYAYAYLNHKDIYIYIYIHIKYLIQFSQKLLVPFILVLYVYSTQLDRKINVAVVLTVVTMLPFLIF